MLLFILFYFILFYFILFYFILFYLTEASNNLFIAWLNWPEMIKAIRLGLNFATRWGYTS